MPDYETQLAEAADEYRAHLDARRRLRALIREAKESGMQQIDILRATNHVYSREEVRKICKKR